MTIIDGLAIFGLILFFYFLIVFILYKKGLMKKYNISFFGPALMIKTKKGIKFLKKLARHKKFWKGFGTSGIIICLTLMILFTVFFVYTNFSFILSSTPEQRAALPGAEIILVYPGINPALPIETIGYFIIAFIVAVIVHEFSHGILSLVGKIKVKSLGVLLFILPVGAFCEPDEEELTKADTVKRMRVYAAGPLANFTAAIAVILILTFVFMPAVSQIEGMEVLSSAMDTPAEEIGLNAGCVITNINGTVITNLTTYYKALGLTLPNRTINITYFTKGEYIKKEVKLDSLYKYDKSNESYKNISVLGAGLLNPDNRIFDYVKNPFTNDFPFSFLVLSLLPLANYLIGYSPIDEPFTNAYQIEGFFSAISPEAFWVIFTVFFWVFWLNFLLGLFNILPLIPLDGGYLFKDGFSLFLKKTFKNINEEKREKISKNVIFIVSLFILFAIVSQFFVKYI